MRLLLSIVFALASSVAFTQITEEAKLLKTISDFHQALVDKNTISINQQTDKGLSYGHSNGWVQTKADLIKDFETNYISYQKIKEDSVTITRSGTMANVRFVADVTATMKSATNTYRLKVLEVWVKKGNRWLLFARQAIKA